MKRRILVAYATRYGSTAEVAKSIADTLVANGESVDLLMVKDVRDLAPYKAVIVGSAIRFGGWLPEAVDFIKANLPVLNTVPTSYFTVCMTIFQDTEENRLKASAFLDPVRKILKPTSEGWFAGRLDYDQISLWQRWLAKAIKFPDGDFRDWPVIQEWANQAAHAG